MGRLLVGVVLLLHGVIHMMGVAKAFEWAELDQLTQPISRGWGIVWAACAGTLVAAAVTRWLDVSWWWILGAVAIVASQGVVIAFWGDAKAGTVANVLLVVPVALGFGSWRFAGAVERELSHFTQQAVSSEVTDRDLQRLPPVVAKWLRRAGVVGRPRDRTVHLTQRGEMQTTPGGTWMPFRAEQWFDVAEPAFLWVVDVEAGYGVSLAGRDRYRAGTGSMRIELLSLVPVVAASGPKIDQGTLLRFLAETMWFPSAALAPYLEWEAVDAHAARAVMRHGGLEVNGTFHFDEVGDVVSFEAKRHREDVLEDWTIENDAFAPMDGVRIPTQSTVSWGGADKPRWLWLRLAIDGLTRGAAIR